VSRTICSDLPADFAVLLTANHVLITDGKGHAVNFIADEAQQAALRTIEGVSFTDDDGGIWIQRGRS